ncbi:DNA-binding response regulator [Streptomyces sp. GMY02]|uniref:helix-turn-helix transcriptional regulator n=1 Tax=Streptomyces sp. GMY02 TaxID=1333528 RepID=UPI001C2CAA36|nr:DNA-binding response regulator [Streptomyces sp. GMY02]QXE36761.1 DNA-binding response regulator [Streptomyces sp. GMY02]
MADVPGSVLNRSALSLAVVREDVVDTLHPPGRQIRGVRQVMATLTALVRSARRELLVFDDPGSCLGQCIPEQFLEFAGACVRAAGDQDWQDGGAGPGRGAGTGSGGKGRARAPSVGVRRIVPRHGLAGLPYPLPRQLPGRARQTDSIPFKMILVDRTVAAIPIDLQLHYHGVLLIRDPVVVQALVRTHQAWWETGEELPTAALPTPGVLPGQLRPVLEALLAGLTDETAATRLGMSSRTYSRRVGDLLTALGTTSRFRAGAEAARRGWI